MLGGKSVFIRAMELEDSRIISAWLNDRDSNEYLDIIYPASKRYSDSFVLEADEDKSKRMFIIDNQDRKPIGMIIINNIKWEHRNCEIGIAIYDKNSRGRGYGKDTLETILNFIFNEMNLHLVYVNVMEDNKRAIGLYKSLGFKEEGILKDRYFKSGEYKSIIVMSKINEGR